MIECVSKVGMREGEKLLLSCILDTPFCSCCAVSELRLWKMLNGMEDIWTNCALCGVPCVLVICLEAAAKRPRSENAKLLTRKMRSTTNNNIQIFKGHSIHQRSK